MDQDSFRALLAKGPTAAAPPAKSSATSHPSGSTKSKGKTKKADPSQPAFKPRAVKKHDSYRDRAEERRLGVAHDYAQVEALAEDFEKRNADKDRATVDEERRYLGGDSEHTVLVKGLDFALLEQNRARAAAAAEDVDDELEQAFVEAAQPKKRTREDLIQLLKNKRQKASAEPGGDANHADADANHELARDVAVDAEVEAAKLEEAKKAGKFKPIGFKPIGAVGKKTKKVKAKAKGAEKEGTKKKHSKTSTETAEATNANEPAPQASTSKASVPKLAPPLPPPPVEEPVDEDFDIFADAGEYTGVDLGSEGEDEDEGEVHESTPEDTNPPKARWFDTDDHDRDHEMEDGERAESPHPTSKSKSPPAAASGSGPAPPAPEREDGETEEEELIRLAPLASSAMPSIKEYLAMEAEAEREEKRRARKEKKRTTRA